MLVDVRVLVDGGGEYFVHGNHGLAAVFDDVNGFGSDDANTFN